MMDFEVFRQRFDRYVMTFADQDGKLPVAALCKQKHTHDVCAVMDDLLLHEPGFSAHEAFLFRLCALFHDVSRFEQYQKFGTFRDADSFDHGMRSVELIQSMGLIQELSPEDTALVTNAIRVHNQFRIPDDFPKVYRNAAMMLRDADKIDILNLILTFFEHPERFSNDKTIRLDLPDTPSFRKELVEEVFVGRCIHYSEMRSINDFKLSLFAWVNDYQYQASAVYLLEHDFYGKLRLLMPTDEPWCDDLLAHVRNQLSAKAQQPSNRKGA